MEPHASGSSISATASWPWSPRPVRRGCPTRSRSGPARPSCGTRSWRRSSPGLRSPRAARRSSRALGVARPAGTAAALADTATRPPRAAVAALVAALGSGDGAARPPRHAGAAGPRPRPDSRGRRPSRRRGGRRRRRGRPAGACRPTLRTLTTPLSATLLELAAAGAGPLPVHALLDPVRDDWRAALRELEALGASSGRAIALGVGAAAAVLGARRPAARCATLPV